MRTEEGVAHRGKALDVAIVGSGVSGLSAAWLLSSRHRTTLFEAEDRLGGHSRTSMAGGMAVDTGFIVYNDETYPNLSALFERLGVPVKSAGMSFSVSLDDGRLEYSGSGLRGLFAQPLNAVKPRFWLMLRDVVRFYREAPRDVPRLGAMSLGDYVEAAGYGEAFRDDHLFPMAAAIWSTPTAKISDYPAAAFIRFCETHGLLKLSGRPVWRTVEGGSREYVRRLAAAIAHVATRRPIRGVSRMADGVEIVDAAGERRKFDHVVIATHADQALSLLADPSAEERRLLGAFGYTSNEAVLHNDASLMPKRRAAWASWNYASRCAEGAPRLALTYWMNRLQTLPEDVPLFVTLNPHREVAQGAVFERMSFRHPIFDVASLRAQRELWSLQGLRRTWFCGAYFGSGFHEDGLQAGLAVAEELGGVRRPWKVADESGRIRLGESARRPATETAG